MEGGRETIVKNKFSKSIGSGIKSLTSGGRDFFILEHKTNSTNFRAGSQKEIIVGYIELGRDPNCAIRFSEQEKTVSRRHAAINKEGDNYVLLNLSNINPTLLNGRPVAKKYYLNSGDEIQLSVEGPRLGFIVPSNNKTGSLSIGKRMSLFREQALRPYKRAIAGLGVALALVMLVGGYFLFQLNQENRGLETDLEEAKTLLEDTVAITTERADSLQQVNEQLATEKEEAQRRANRLTRRLRNAESAAPAAGSAAPARPGSQTAQPNDVNSLYKDVYYVKVTQVTVRMSDGEERSTNELSWTGTGFLTNDNRFVTARHVIEPWFYPINSGSEGGADENLLLINILLHNYGATIEMKIEAISSSGEKLVFSSSDFTIDRTQDKPEEIEIEDQPHVVRLAIESPNDIAFARINKEGGLSTSPQIAANLQATEKLYLLGYPLGFGATDLNDISPIYSTATVARSGLEAGSIITTDGSIESGNSGGPVFVKRNESYQVIGVVSGGWGENIGKIVPISLIY
ncbi:MAG: FHA domain-containing protein [Phaeodactylibacter xiamenensis]|uniref:FHA domain-containing protein n=1 Tax=Phaeodactylibacter xiamenensis TaxID=1524460 RepID=A0A098S3V4_9BACT|nr:FHA domain-containing protein [Phaeodactylibacter xiamenensis]KGE85822.1 hypothetical protein IX84_24630 [Phaeodactylibacter xiamenensis]MCR9051198.1 FHA domain-containing protein [bacterium]